MFLFFKLESSAFGLSVLCGSSVLTTFLRDHILQRFGALSCGRGSTAATIRLMIWLSQFTLVQCTSGFHHAKMFTSISTCTFLNCFCAQMTWCISIPWYLNLAMSERAKQCPFPHPLANTVFDTNLMYLAQVQKQQNHRATGLYLTFLCRK